MRILSRQNLEADLDGDEDQILPDLLAKLLYALTYNRQVKSVIFHCYLYWRLHTPSNTSLVLTYFIGRSELMRAMFYSRDNALEHLRKQYAKRAPETNALGTVEEPVSWATLGLGQKVSARFAIRVAPLTMRPDSNLVGALRVANGQCGTLSCPLEE